MWCTASSIILSVLIFILIRSCTHIQSRRKNEKKKKSNPGILSPLYTVSEKSLCSTNTKCVSLSRKEVHRVCTCAVALCIRVDRLLIIAIPFCIVLSTCANGFFFCQCQWNECNLQFRSKSTALWSGMVVGMFSKSHTCSALFFVCFIYRIIIGTEMLSAFVCVYAPTVQILHIYRPPGSLGLLGWVMIARRARSEISSTNSIILRKGLSKPSADIRGMIVRK